MAGLGSMIGIGVAEKLTAAQNIGTRVMRESVVLADELSDVSPPLRRRRP